MTIYSAAAGTETFDRTQNEIQLASPILYFKIYSIQLFSTTTCSAAKQKSAGG
jgi:hypothetical protein